MIWSLLDFSYMAKTHLLMNYKAFIMHGSPDNALDIFIDS